MLHSVTTERRQHRRYLVEGKAVIISPLGRAPAEVVNVGRGGLLAFCKAPLSVDDPLEVRFEVQGYPLVIRCNAHVVRKEPGVVGIRFDAEPPGIEEVILWLETEFLAGLL